jgi:hypothetical protein
MPVRGPGSTGPVGNVNGIFGHRAARRVVGGVWSVLAEHGTPWPDASMDPGRLTGGDPVVPPGLRPLPDASDSGPGTAYATASPGREQWGLVEHGMTK